MHLALIISSLNSGGAERVLTDLANYWVSKGHQVTLTTLAESDAKPFYPLDSKMRLVQLHQYFNADVYGLDYSEVGCEKSRNLLKHYNIPGEIYCADLFSPPTNLLQKFDLVVSFGVVEHFEDTAHCLKSCAAFVKPEGLLLTLIPNIPSIIGFIQKYVDKDVYDVHVPLTKEKMVDAHKSAALELEYCDYFMSMNLSVVNSGSFSHHRFNPFLRHILSGTSKVSWILERYGLKILKNRLTSPYIMAVAKV